MRITTVPAIILKYGLSITKWVFLIKHYLDAYEQNSIVNLR